MITLKPFGDSLVPADIASLFVGLQHLDTDECVTYLVTKVGATDPTDLESLETDLRRIAILFTFIGFPETGNLGSGTIKLMDDFLGQDIPYIQSYLLNLNDQILGLGTEDRGLKVVIRSELSAALSIASQYLLYLVQTILNEMDEPETDYLA